MLNRRDFIGKAALGSMAIGLTGLPLDVLGNERVEKLTILHTNDVHSQIEPFPDDHKTFPGMGGAAVRAAIINKIREEEKNVLLLDAGDIFQGTPYFNFFGGEIEFKLMSQMGFDASTLGNHDFDLGVENLVKQMPHALFPFVNCNYDFTNSALNGKIASYKIIQKGRIKIGITGVGIQLSGLVPDQNYEGIVYNNPVEKLQKVADFLRHEEKCHLVICLSHLGYKYDDNQKISDIYLAETTKNIDVFIGGHTHTFLDKPTVHRNLEDRKVLINQVGWAGVNIGRLDIFFEKNLKKNTAFGNTVIVDKNAIGNRFF
ncbi:MAG: metallophosphatase [Chitinophagales bacterium]|nr:metallophosphatase [Chitinophagales bacterium]